jgi:hypothetical protein
MLIEPFKSVGKLSFDDTRQQIREKINERFETNAKVFTGYCEYYDYFYKSGLFVYYNKKDKVNAFEFFEPNPDFNGVNLLTQPYHQLLEMFKQLDQNLEIDYNGFTSYRYGIGGNTNDDPETEGAMPEAVIIFRQSYYDELNKRTLKQKILHFFRKS